MEIEHSHSHNESALANSVLDVVREQLRLILPPLFLLVGLPGNVISFIIWSRRISNNPGSTNLLLTVMCATDTYVLCQGCVRNWLLSLTSSGWDLRYHLGCALPLFLFTFFSDLSVWIIILLCLERFICVMWPVKAKQLCAQRKGALTLSLVVMLLIVVNFHFFWTIEPDESNNCDWVHKNATLFTTMWSFIDFTVYSFLPLFAVIVLNSSILIILHGKQSRLHHTKSSDSRFSSLLKNKKSSQKRVLVNSQGSTSLETYNDRPSRPVSASAGRFNKIFKTIIWMTISHFAFTMPIVNFYLLGDSLCTDDSTRSPCDFIECICLMLQLANHFTHFFIYSLTSSVFTEDLVKWMPLCQMFIRNERQQAMSPTTRTSPCQKHSHRRCQVYSQSPPSEQLNTQVVEIPLLRLNE